MKIPFYIVDAFTSTPFKGNQTAVVLLEKPQSEEWMQRVAMEFGYSETAFLVNQPLGKSSEGEEKSEIKSETLSENPETKSETKRDFEVPAPTLSSDRKVSSSYSLRWFTPTAEVDLCGHATLGAAHVLWNEKNEEGNTIIFITKSGALPVYRNSDWAQLDFPCISTEQVTDNADILKALGLEASEVVFTGKAKWDLLVEIESEEKLTHLKPNMSELIKLPYRCISVTAASSTDFFSYMVRVFAPSFGINEDPVTGSAQCYLAPYWKTKLNQTHLVCYQASKRGGLLKVSFKENDHSRILISGRSVTFSKGEILVSPDYRDWKESSQFF